MALRKLNKIAAAVAATMAMSAAQAESISFSRMYTLGDSLTDGGAFGYRFMNDSLTSKTYAELLADRLGLSLPVVGPPLFGAFDGSSGGNFAQGGARVSAGGPVPSPITSQVSLLLTGSPILSSKDLVIVWAGANDVINQFGVVAATAPADQTAALLGAVGSVRLTAVELASAVQDLYQAGAKSPIVILLPDISKTPLGTIVGAGGQLALSSLSASFNTALTAGALSSNAFIIDSNRILTSIIDDPIRFGFNSNTIGLNSTVCGVSNPGALTSIPPDPSAYYASSGLTCSESAPGSNPEGLFADAIHPSAQAHAIFGEILMGSLRAISQASNLATGPMIAARQHAMELENRLHLNAMLNADGKARAVGKVHVYGGAEGGSFKDSAGQIDPSVDTDTQRYRVGIDQQFSSSMMGGVLLSYGNGKTSFGANTGQIKTNEVTATAYLSKALSANTYINASIGMGTIDHDFQRNIVLDTTTLSTNSKPKGRYESYRVGGGGVYNVGGWKVGPNASLAHEKVTIERFDEGAGPASMSFGEMDYTVQRLSLGLSLDQSAPVGQWRGFGRLVHDWDLNSDDLQVRVGHAAGTLASFDLDRSKTMWQASLGIMRPAGDGSTLSLSVGFGGREGGGDTRTIGLNYRIEL